jgi:hypothetical protein
MLTSTTKLLNISIIIIKKLILNFLNVSKSATDNNQQFKNISSNTANSLISGMKISDKVLQNTVVNIIVNTFVQKLFSRYNK